jgi:hypothetical protein
MNAAMGPAETAIRRAVCEGDRLATPTYSEPFWVGRISTEGIILELGKRRTPSFFTWDCLEGALLFLEKQRRVRINGSGKSTRIVPGTLDGYLKGHINRVTAGWVAVLLEKSGVAIIERSHPAFVRTVENSRRD